MKQMLFLLTVLSLVLAACGSAAPLPPEPAAETTVPLTPTSIPTPVPGVLYVDPSQSLGPISPLIYGSNYGPWLVVSLEMLPAAYDSGVTILRFPAGSWGDQNDVRTYQIDQFMDFAEKVGAEAIFTVRLLDGTPEKAAEMVHYTNIEKGYNVRYWNIGNEPTLYNGVMQNRGETYDVNRFNQEWRRFAEAMKAVDPSIQLVGPEINQFSHDKTPGMTTNFGEWDETWMVEFLKANGGLVDVVSFHRYPYPATRVSGAPSKDELRLSALEWDLIFHRARELIHEHTGRDLPIAVTEFNSAYDKSFGGETTPDSHYNAVWMAAVLASMVRNGVFMANQWALTAKAGYGGLGLVGQYDVFPSYYTYQMYKMFGNQQVLSSSDDPDLSIVAAQRQDGALTVLVINLSSEEKAKPLRIGGRSGVQAEAWLFDPDHKAEYVGTFELSAELTFPPQSVTLYVIP